MPEDGNKGNQGNQGNQGEQGNKGEQGTPSPADLAQRQQTPPAPTTPPTPQTQPTPPTPQQGDAGRPEHPWDTPDTAKAEIERLRRENGDARIEAKNQAAEDARREQLLQFAKVLGFEIPGEEPPTIDSLTQKVQASSEREQAATHDAALVQEAWDQGVNPAKLEYLRYLVGKQTFEVGTKEYGAKLKEAIAGEIAKDSTLKLSGAGTASGVASFAGGDGQKPITKEQFDGMTMAERTKLYQTDKTAYDRLTAER